MRSLRKTLVTALIVAMVCGLAGTAFASTVAGKAFTDIGGHAYAKELTMARALGIMMGDAGTTIVRPDAPITRAEFCIVVVRMLGRDALAVALSTYQPTFSDEVPTWAWGHVNVAVSMGIIKGYGDGRFGGSDNVTHAEAVAMLVRATGHDPAAIGIWPVNYMIAGYDLGIIGKVDAFAMLPATRGEVAHFVYNAMDIKQGLGTGANYNPLGKAKILNDGDTPPIKRQWKGVAGAFSATDKTLVVGGTTLNLADSVYLWTYGAFSELFNTQVRAVANTAGKVVFAEPHVAVNVVKGVYDKAETIDSKTYLVLKDGTKVEYVSTTKVSLNRATAADLVPANHLAANDQLTITLAEGKASFVDAFRIDLSNLMMTAAPVAATSTAKAKVTIDDSQRDVLATATITVNGAAAAVTDLKKDDVVYAARIGAATDGDVFYIESIRQTVTGAWLGSRQVWTAADKFDYYIKLRLADGTERELKWYVKLASAPTEPTAGSTVIYALDKAGNARAVLAATIATNYVKVLNVSTTATSGKYSVGVDVRGTTVNYITGLYDVSTWAAKIGEVGQIGINASTGEINAWTFLWKNKDGLGQAQVHAVDTANNVITLRLYSGGSLTHTYFITHPEFTCYQAGTGDSSVGAFISTANLAVGAKVYFALATDGRVLFILRKADQTAW